MDRQLLSVIAHTDHPVAAPLVDESVDRLLRRTRLPEGARILDLGCGEGAWLIRALQMYPTARAEGVDVSRLALEQAGDRAAQHGVADRMTLREMDAAGFASDEQAHLALCVGSTHAFGGIMTALKYLRPHLRDDGVVLIGDGFWEQKPNDVTLVTLGSQPDEFDDLATTVSKTTAGGWTLLYGHVSTPYEWDEYEWSWTGAVARWAVDHPEHALAGAAMAAADAHRDGWLRGCRGILGFVTMLLRPAA